MQGCAMGAAAAPLQSPFPFSVPKDLEAGMFQPHSSASLRVSASPAWPEICMGGSQGQRSPITGRWGELHDPGAVLCSADSVTPLCLCSCAASKKKAAGVFATTWSQTKQSRGMCWTQASVSSAGGSAGRSVPTAPGKSHDLLVRVPSAVYK